MSELLPQPSADAIIDAAHDVSALESLRIETAKDYEKTQAIMRWLFPLPILCAPLALGGTVLKIINDVACLTFIGIATVLYFKKRRLASALDRIEDAIHIAKNKHLTRFNTSVPATEED